jgi:hypothetical protein
LTIVNDTDRIREETYRLWVTEGRPNIPRSAIVERAMRIMAAHGPSCELPRNEEPRPAVKPPLNRG